MYYFNIATPTFDGLTIDTIAIQANQYNFNGAR
jgi:hypothetical protein